MIDGDQLKTIEARTDFKYFPTDGDYTDSNITLTDVLSLSINENLSKASKYEAPNKAEAILGGLDGAGNYIL